MSISIDIGERHIKIVEIEQTNSKIKKAIFTEIEESIINNGYITNKIELTLTVADLVNKYNLKGKKCTITINSTDIIRKELTLPVVKNNTLINMIKSNISDLSENEVCIDYKIIDKVIVDNNNFYKIMVYSIPIKMVKSYRDLLNNVGLIPKRLNIASESINNVLDRKINDTYIKDRTVLFLEINKKNTIISLLSNGNTLYSKNIDLSNEQKFTERYIYNQNKEDEILKEIATTIQEDSINDNKITFLDDDDDIIFEQMSFVSPIFIRIDEEIHKIMQFFMSISNVGTIDKVYTFGNYENIEEITEYIATNIIPNSERISKISNLTLDKNIDISIFFIAITSALRK